MMKILRSTEYLYLAVAVLSIYEISQTWSTERDRSYLFILFAVISLGMFFFRRRYRRKFEAQRRRMDSDKE